MVQKRTRGELCHSINRYSKANNKHMKDYDKSKESLYPKYWDVNNFGWAMPQKFSVNGFKWFEGLSEPNKDFIKCYNEKSNERYFLRLIYERHNDLPFFVSNKIKLIKSKNL